MIEGNDAELAIGGCFGHFGYLVVDGGLDTLHPGDISHVGLALYALVRSITELHQLLHSLGSITLDTVLSEDLLTHTHGPRNIYGEDNGDILAHELFVEHLSGCLNYVIDFFAYRDLLWLNLYRVLGIAELASPELARLTFVLLLFFYSTVHVKGGVA
jgi:hypothetical protein